MHPHLLQRGNTYQWRRKARRFSTGNIDIKLSLGTTDRHLAHILARKVSSELRRIKNLSSRRMIVIPSHLIDLGFIDHVQKTKMVAKTASFQSYMK